MKKVTTRKGQTVMDVALQHCADGSLWHEVAQRNGLEATWTAAGGEELMVPDGDAKTLQKVEKENVVPCTGGEGLRDGIGYERVGEMMVG